MYTVTNISASDINLGDRNLAPKGSTTLSEISLVLRSLEEIKAIKITPIKEEPKVKPTVTVNEPVKVQEDTYSVETKRHKKARKETYADTDTDMGGS